MWMKYYVLVCLLCYMMLGSYTWSQSAVQAIKPRQSSSMVMRNDCGLTMTNRELLTKIHGEDGTKALSASDITTAYNWTVGHPDCGGKKSQYNEPSTTNFVQNLCTIAILKLEGQAEKYGLQSFQQAKELYQILAKDGTNPDGAPPTTIYQEFIKALGDIHIIGSHTSPQKCGVIDLSNNQGVKALYFNMADAIFNIATDCGTSIPYTPLWREARITMIKPGQTPYAFGSQQGINSIAYDISSCRDRLKTAQQKLMNQAQVVSILSQHRYTMTNNQQWMDYIIEKEKGQKESLAKAMAFIDMTIKDTPTTPVCVAK